MAIAGAPIGKRMVSPSRGPPNRLSGTRPGSKRFGIGSLQLQLFIFVLQRGHVAHERLDIVARQVLRDRPEPCTQCVTHRAEASVPPVAIGKIMRRIVTGSAEILAARRQAGVSMTVRVDGSVTPG